MAHNRHNGSQPFKEQSRKISLQPIGKVGLNFAPENRKTALRRLPAGHKIIPVDDVHDVTPFTTPDITGRGRMDESRVALFMNKAKAQPLRSPSESPSPSPNSKTHSFGKNWDKIKFAMKMSSAFKATLPKWGETHSLALTESLETDVLMLTNSNAKKLEKFKYYISYSSQKRGIWDMMGLLFVLFEVYYMPYSWTFAGDYPESAWIDTLTILIDIGVNIMTTFKDLETMQVVCGPPKRLVQNYFSNFWFIVDFLSGIPWHRFAVESSQQNFEAGGRNGGGISGLRFLKVIRFVRVLKVGKRLIKVTRKSAIVVRLILMVLAFMTIVHLLCCGYYAIQSDGIDTDINNSSDVVLKYVVVLSVVLANMFAAGLPMASTKAEFMFLSITMCVGALCSAVIFGSVATIIGEFNEAESQFSKFMVTLQRRMAHKQLPKHIRDRVSTHYEVQWNTERHLENDRHTFLQDLSPALSRDVSLALCRDIIDKIPVSMTSSATESLVLHMDVQQFLREDLILRAGDYGDWLGFVGQNSQAGVHIMGRIVNLLKYGAHFGESCLFEENTRSADIVALRHCCIYILTKENFVLVKQAYPKEINKLEEKFRSLLLKSKNKKIVLDAKEDKKEKLQQWWPSRKISHVRASISMLRRVSRDQKFLQIRKQSRLSQQSHGSLTPSAIEAAARTCADAVGGLHTLQSNELSGLSRKNSKTSLAIPGRSDLLREKPKVSLVIPERAELSRQNSKTPTVTVPRTGRLLP